MPVRFLLKELFAHAVESTEIRSDVVHRQLFV